MTIFAGPHLNGDNYFLDPTPSDSSEFEGTIINPFTGDAQSKSPAAGSTDFVSLVTHEMGHALGLNNFGGLKLLDTPYFVNTQIPNQGAPGYYWLFQDGPDNHLFTSNNKGTEDLGYPVHTAFPGSVANYNGQTYYGTNDLMIAGSQPGRRYLIPSWVALMFQDVYGYTVVAPSLMPNFYAMQDSDGGVLVRTTGGDSTVSVDQFAIGFADFIQVQVSISNPGNGVDPNPTYTRISSHLRSRR